MPLSRIFARFGHLRLTRALCYCVPFVLAGCSLSDMADIPKIPEPDDPPIRDGTVEKIKVRRDYLSESVDEHTNVPIRWTKQMPLTVYFHPVDKDVRTYRPKMRLLMHTALASWSKKSDNTIRFKVVQSLPADHDISISKLSVMHEHIPLPATDK